MSDTVRSALETYRSFKTTLLKVTSRLVLFTDEEIELRGEVVVPKSHS